ncbi:YfhO family protein, partial [Streptococcus suis]
EFTLENAFSFFNVGSFTTDVQFQFDVYFPENNQVYFDKPQFYRLDLLAFQQAISILQEKKVVKKTDGNKVNLDFLNYK